MDYPTVKVTELEKRPDNSFGPTANLASNPTEEQLAVICSANALLQQFAERAKAFFLLEWEGNKIPRGADINGKKVAWTQNGLVTSDDGVDIGTYERLVEFGGASGKEQKMLIFAI